MRRIERNGEDRGKAEADLVLGDCSAVRSAITDDGRPSPGAPGLRLRRRLDAIPDSLDRVAAKGGSRHRSRACAG